MHRRAYVEITNACNLACRFCARSLRPQSFMPVSLFENIAAQAKPLANIFSLHVLGEPFMHPQLPGILATCSGAGIGVNLVTNGTLLNKFGKAIFSENCLRQLSFSLHALGELPETQRTGLLVKMVELAEMKPAKLVISFRLRGDWQSPFCAEIRHALFSLFPHTGKTAGQRGGVKLAENVFLNSGEFYGWPGNPAAKREKPCLGLKHHFAVLCDGQVTPCCADYDGRLALGNIKDTPLAEILRGEKALALRAKLANGKNLPDHCLSCNFRMG